MVAREHNLCYHTGMAAGFENMILDVSIAGNTVSDYFIAAVVFIVALVILKIAKTMIVGRVQAAVRGSATQIDDAILKVFETVRPPFYMFIAFYGATRLLTLSGLPEKILNVVLLSWVTWQVIAALQIFADYLVRARLETAADVAHQAVSGIIGGLAKILLWVVGILFVLSNLGVNINSLLTGIGIGGLALALAARSLLEDLFSSLAIVFDRPFAPGDFIEVDGEKGTVQKVGVKTTRIRALSGEQIIIPNKDLSGARIKNFRRMQERRIAFMLAVAADTPTEKIGAVPTLVEAVVKPLARFRWAHLVEITGKQLTFEVVYFVASDDYSDYLNIHQSILLGIKSALEREGIRLAG